MTHAADVHGPCHSEQNRRFTKGLIHDIIEFWDGEQVGGLGGGGCSSDCGVGKWSTDKYITIL